ncbi:unnamed protein product [Owenia fusiformis]|uniref:FLYWCH-type domain-containing protein n=1 Tax=Owenia fusiformis TaxID=6347 RepID=A0A8S4QAA9_OWEFU|nr:unnamed protein product [Owenia fusiformis]
MDVDPEYSTTMPVVNMDLPNGDSFNVDRPFDVPDRFEEDTLQEMSLPTNISEPVTESVTYSIVEGATQRGNPLLVDSEGFIYTVKKTLPGRTTWRCKVRGKSGNCSAMVFQSNSVGQGVCSPQV